MSSVSACFFFLVLVYEKIGSPFTIFLALDCTLLLLDCRLETAAGSSGSLVPPHIPLLLFLVLVYQTPGTSLRTHVAGTRAVILLLKLLSVCAVPLIPLHFASAISGTGL